MNESLDRNNSKDIREKIKQALDDNDIETICYIASEGLINEEIIEVIVPFECKGIRNKEIEKKRSNCLHRYLYCI